MTHDEDKQNKNRKAQHRIIKICATCQKTKEFEDTKRVIRICISKKNRQHNGQKEKYERTNNDIQNIHIKLKIE